MAERRMFTKTIIDSDIFLDMPLSAQSLYFHLSMRADDDGFINNPKKIQRMIGASDDDLKLLVLKSFIIPFDTGIVVIKHWRMHNYIRKDTYKETIYKAEKDSLSLDENSVYIKACDVPVTQSLQCRDVSVTQPSLSCDEPLTQDRLGKDRLGKDSIGKDKDVINYQKIIDMYNTTCVSYPKVRNLSESRKKAIKARLKKYSLEDLKQVFTLAEESDFMKGSNNRNWVADFDWMIKDVNMVKILELKYANKEVNNNVNRVGRDISRDAKPNKEPEVELPFDGF